MLGCVVTEMLESEDGQGLHGKQGTVAWYLIEDSGVLPGICVAKHTKFSCLTRITTVWGDGNCASEPSIRVPPLHTHIDPCPTTSC